MSFLVGFLAGVFGGLVGLGGGVIMIPLVILAYKLPQRQAQGTSLVVVIFSGLAGALTYGWKGSIDVGAALLLGAAAVFSTRAGVRYGNALPEHNLRRYFGAFLIAVSLLLTAKPYIGVYALTPAGWLKSFALLAVGLATGFISGLLGVGGGVFMVSAMVLLAGMNQHIAQGSSLLAIVPTAAVGAHTYRKHGNVATVLLPGLIAGVLLGTYAGGSIALALPEGSLRLIFAAVLAFLGIRYVWNSEKGCH